LVYEFLKDGTDIQKLIGAGEDHALKSVFNLFYKLISTEVFTVFKDQVSMFNP